jgi:hypothetical protein
VRLAAARGARALAFIVVAGAAGLGGSRVAYAQAVVAPAEPAASGQGSGATVAPPARPGAVLAPAAAAFETVSATVKVFELTARASPGNQAPVLETFVEGTRLEVSKDATQGWRRLVLADGRLAFIAEAGLALPGAGARVATRPPVEPLVAPPPPVVVARPPVAVPVPVPVPDLYSLASAVAPDDVVSPMARRLVSRATAATVTSMACIGLGAAAAILAMTAFTSEHCASPTKCTSSLNSPLLFTGVGLMVAGPVVGFALYPRKSAALSVIDAWNTRHATTPLVLELAPEP